MKKTALISAALAAFGLSLSGCSKQAAPAGAGARPPAGVRTVSVKMEEVNPVSEYIAHVEPVQQVNLMAQVSGTIEGIHFDEGTRVTKGQLLFTLDAAMYEATLAQREAELAQELAALDRAEKFLAMLKSADNRSVSKSDLDTAEANMSEGQALVKKAEAAVRQAQIDLGYTKISSPIDGRIGRALITTGNLVSPSSGALATVIQVDPIRVVFAMPDAEYLTAFERYSNDETYAPRLTVRLANGVVLPGEGAIEFDDNQMNPATGTIDIHLRFDNPSRLLVPNNFVTVMVEERNAPDRIVVPVESILYGADGPFVWCVTAEHTAVPKPVVPGVVVGRRQIIESGLASGDLVVTAGVQSLRPGAPVSIISTEATE
ncbi:MAG: efflux RND transporter periplasmic adaptor subunit [Pontiellaceae bacterium]|nr:efflux RND transporter periplasmic adaptor subunit [Pontiellaceae bacterium]MBN2785812.1 efflux RND transporter periplasmic adaptor subunit [Pontiellaceae bacterium]